MIHVIIVTAIILSVLVIASYVIAARKQRKEAQQYEADLKNHNEYMKQVLHQSRSGMSAEETRKPYPVVSQGSYDRKTTLLTAPDESEDADFLTSMAVAAATDSALIGMAVGGDPIGAMIGDAMNDSDSTDHGYSDSHSDYSSDSSSDSSDWDSSDSSSSDY